MTIYMECTLEYMAANGLKAQVEKLLEKAELIELPSVNYIKLK